MSTNFPAHNPIQARMIKTHTEEDHPEEIPTTLTILDCQEEDHPEEDCLDHLKEEGYQIGSPDIQEEDCLDPPRDPQEEDCQAQGHQEDHHPETPETIEIKMMDSDSTWK